MLFFGGIGMFMGGLIITLFGKALHKDEEKVAKAQKQAPLLMAVGAVFLAAWYYVTYMM